MEARPVHKEHVATWPRPVRQAVDAIATLLSAVFLLARARAADHASRFVRALARDHHRAWREDLLRRESDLLRSRLRRLSPAHRPHYAPDERFAILQLMRLRGWTPERTAERLVLHVNTVRQWLKEFNLSPDAPRFTGAAPFNKLSQASRWLVHEIRALCPDPSFGTRSIAAQIVRAGIKLSRSSVQRILREPQPSRPPAPAALPSEPVIPFHILRPMTPNRTWHLDLATVQFLWLRFYVAALLDGYSRKLLALRVYHDAPGTREMLALVRAAGVAQALPRFLVTDHGCQFGPRFRRALARKAVALVKGRRRSCQFNGKVERFFRTLRLWQRVTLFAWRLTSIQRKLDLFRAWYNAERPIYSLGSRTPDDLWAGAHSPAPLPLRQNNPVKPALSVRRVAYRGDPNLIALNIQIVRSVRRIA